MTSLPLDDALEIGIVMDFPILEVVQGVRSYCDEKGIKVDARWSVRGDWVPKEVDWNGVIYKIVSNDSDALRERISKWHIEKVSLLPEGDEYLVCNDYAQAGVLAAEEFLAAGVKRILAVDYSVSEVSHQFISGCLEKMFRSGAAGRALDMCQHKILGMNEAASFVVQELQKECYPVGLCSAHAGFMMTVEKCLLKQGIRIPEDVAIIVLDKDVQQTAALSPVPITGIVLDSWMQGYVAAEVLHKKLLGEAAERKRSYIHPKGINKRESTGHLSESDPVMAKALSYIRANYTKAIGVSDVVDAVGASRRVVEMRFREILDRGVGEEINRLRMEAAKNLLKEKRHKIAEVAEMAGFTSLHYFSAAFKRSTGVSPRAYQSQPFMLDK